MNEIFLYKHRHNLRTFLVVSPSQIEADNKFRRYCFGKEFSFKEFKLVGILGRVDEDIYSAFNVVH